jgi:hypothetical protein
MQRLLNREFERPDISTSMRHPQSYFRSVLKGQAQESGKPDCYFGCELWSHSYDRKPKDISPGRVYDIMCRGNQGQSIFKELAKEYAKIQRF